MRACLNFSITNKDSNTTQILDLKIEGNKPSASSNADSVPYYRASDNGLHSTRDAMSAGSEVQHTEMSGKLSCAGMHR